MLPYLHGTKVLAIAAMTLSLLAAGTFLLSRPARASWTTIATAATVPVLGAADLEDYYLSFSEENDSFFLGTRFDTTDSYVWADAASVTVTETDRMSQWPGISGDVEPGDTTVAFTAAPRTLVEIASLNATGSWSALGIGVAGPTGAGAATVPALAYGQILGARKPGEALAAPPYVTPVRREGIPERIDGATVLRRFSRAYGLNAFVGCDWFGVPIWADHDDPSSVVYPTTYNAACVVGVPSDIMQTPQGRWYIDSTAAISTTLSIFDNVEAGIGSADIPIPNDPEFGGVVLCFQWWVVIPTGVALSDIICVLIRDTEVLLPNPVDRIFPQGTDASSPPYHGPGVTRVRPPDSINRKRLLRKLLANHEQRMATPMVLAMIEAIRRR